MLQFVAADFKYSTFLKEVVPGFQEFLGLGTYNIPTIENKSVYLLQNST